MTEQRLRFVEEHGLGLHSMTALCAAYGISREAGYKWLERFRAQGIAGLADRSRAPLCQARAVPREIEERILELRRSYATWGPAKIKAHLERTHPQVAWPAQSTIGELFKREGLSVGRRKRQHSEPHAQPFAACGAPNDTWCVDFKGCFEVGDGMRCSPLTLTDGHTRFLLRCQALRAADGAHVKALMEAAFREFGLPRAIRSDNGPPFATLAPGGLSPLSIWWMKLGIEHERIRPGKPQDNGRHERFHRTLKQECASPPAASLRGQQHCFDTFRHIYNEVRPHQALGQIPPAQCYTYSPRPYPQSVAEVWYPPHMHVRRVEKKGQIAWQGERIFLSEALATEPVGLEFLDATCYKLYFMHRPLAILDTKKMCFIRGKQACALEDKIKAKTALEINQFNSAL